MRSYAAVVRCELLGGERLLIAAAVLGLFAWLTAWLPQAQGFDPAEVRGSAALLVSGALALGAVLFLGPGLLARQLAEGRLGFYFARPVSGAALWWGKLTAALGLVATAVVLVWLPALLSGARPEATLVELLEWPGTFRPAAFRAYWIYDSQMFFPFPHLDGYLPQERSLGSPLLWAAFLVLVLLLLAHTVSLTLSSKSPWVAFDLLAAVTVAYGGFRVAGRLSSNLAEGALLTDLTVAGAALFLGLVAAGHAATSAGRTLHRRAHAAASVVLWGVLLVALLGLDAASRRLLAAEAEDLGEVSHFTVAPRGDWLFAGGPVPGESGYSPLFALNPETGRQKKVDVLQLVQETPAFSADGTAAAWTSCRGARCRLLWLDLDDPELPSVGFDFERLDPEKAVLPVALALSRDGRRLAFLRGTTLAVYAMPSLDVLASVELRKENAVDWGPRLAFRDSDTVRLMSRKVEPEGLAVLDFKVSGRRLRPLGILPGWWPQGEPEGNTLAVRTRRDVGVYHAEDLVEIYRVETAENRHNSRLLTGGRLLLAEAGEDGSRLRLFDAQGFQLWTREFDEGVAVGNQTRTGVWLELAIPGEGPEIRLDEQRVLPPTPSFAALEIRLDDGRDLARFPDLLPSWLPAPPGSAASEILVDRSGMPVRRGPDGKTEPLIDLRGRS